MILYVLLFFWPSIFFSQDIRCMTHRRHRRQTEVLRKKRSFGPCVQYNKTLLLCYSHGFSTTNMMYWFYFSLHIPTTQKFVHHFPNWVWAVNWSFCFQLWSWFTELIRRQLLRISYLAYCMEISFVFIVYHHQTVL